LKRQKIENKAETEKSRNNLLQLQALLSVIKTIGQATAEAKARSQASAFESRANVIQAKLLKN